MFSVLEYYVLTKEEISIKQKPELLDKYGFPKPPYIHTPHTDILREYGFTGLAESLLKI